MARLFVLIASLVALSSGFTAPASSVVMHQPARAAAVTMFGGSKKAAPKKPVKKVVKKAAPKKVVKKVVKKAAPPKKVVKKVVKKPIKKAPAGEPSLLQSLFSLSLVGGAKGL